MISIAKHSLTIYAKLSKA